MKFLIVFITGIFSNRYRGGILSNAVNAVIEKLPKFMQSVVRFLVRGDTVNAVLFGSLVQFYGHDHMLSVMCGLAMFAGALPAWGDYVGALGGWRTNTAEQPLHDWPPIDQFLTRWLTEPKIWGFIGLTIRGALWGFLIMLALHSFWPLFAGALMGAVYSVCLKLYGEKGWPIAEWIWGGIFWTLSLISLF